MIRTKSQLYTQKMDVNIKKGKKHGNTKNISEHKQHMQQDCMRV